MNRDSAFVKNFETEFSSLNLEFGNNYDSDFFSELKQICKEISKDKLSVFSGKRINLDNFEVIFTEAMNIFRGTALYDLLTSRAGVLDVNFSKLISNPSLSLIRTSSGYFADAIILPKRSANDESLLLAYAHEIGHIPLYEEKPKALPEIYEYAELLPMLLEYTMCIFLCENDKEKAKDMFYSERLPLEQFASLSCLNTMDKLKEKGNSKIRKKALFYNLADAIKYLDSLSFATCVIDSFMENEKKTKNEISLLAEGKINTTTVKRNLNIDYSLSKKLKKIYNV